MRIPIDIWLTICYYIIVKRLSEKGAEMEEENGMTNDQYVGVIKLIIKMIKEEVPKEKLLEYLEELISK